MLLLTDLEVNNISMINRIDPILLNARGVTVQFPGTLALDDVNFDVVAGEVHVLFGENGAGKSTLIQLLAGVHQATAGEIFLQGKSINIKSVREARELGISAVFQEFSLVPQLTIAENLVLGAESVTGPFLQKKKLEKRAQEILERLGFPLKPDSLVMYLSRAEQQMVEIAKAFRTTPKLMIFDEPTASLTDRETEQLFNLIHQLKRENIGIIYITHRMSEIKKIGDRITVLRDGSLVDTVLVKDVTDKQLVSLMTGRVIDQIFPEIKLQKQGNILEIANLTSADNVIKSVSLDVCAGEVVGIAGLVGSGKSQLGRACFGLEKLASGTISFNGQLIYDSERKLNRLSPPEMLKMGLYYLPSDRRLEGLIMMRNVRENIAVSSLDLAKFSGSFLLRRFRERMEVKEISKKLDLQPLNIEKDVEYFSGGNQQKVLVGKALVRDVKLFILDEPTVGVDVGARVAIYRFIKGLCEAGAGVLLISSDLPEILNLSHRAYVMHRGNCNAEIEQVNLTEENVLKHFFDQENPHLIDHVA